MALFILDEHPPDDPSAHRYDVRRVGEKWAATGDYLGYWVGGFDTQEDAELFADAIESAVDDAKDAVLRS